MVLLANALNASATIFESMAEVDIKFAKFADKECDGVSEYVKKWFKKLAVSAPPGKYATVAGG